MKAGGGGECSRLCPEREAAARPRGAGVAGQAREVGSRVAAPQLLRSGRARVLPTQGALRGVPSGLLSAFGGRAERARPRAAETLRGREVLRGFPGWWLANRM